MKNSVLNEGEKYTYRRGNKVDHIEKRVEIHICLFF